MYFLDINHDEIVTLVIDGRIVIIQHLIAHARIEFVGLLDPTRCLIVEDERIFNITFRQFRRSVPEAVLAFASQLRFYERVLNIGAIVVVIAT